jgi:hypothetical protein
MKYHVHRGQPAPLFFYRDRKGHEVDLIIERGGDRLAVEIKSGRTPSTDYFAALERLETATSSSRKPSVPASKLIAYGGDHSQTRSQGQLLSWSDLDAFDWLAANTLRRRPRSVRS